jgi:histidinol dehydrogenase
MSEKKIKSQSFVERVLAFVKGGDDAKLSRFSSKLEKYYNNQIKMRQDRIETLIDQIDDAQEVLNETILNVDLDRVHKTEEAESYCAIYSRKVAEANAKVKSLQESVESNEDEISELQELKALIFGTE